MLILVDGPDCVGKSTFVQNLVNRLAVRAYPMKFSPVKIELLHKGPPESHPLDEYELPLVSYRPDVGHVVVADRWHLGELVYPGIFDRETQMTPAVFRHIELFLASRGAVVVLLDATTEQISRCIEQRGDDLVTYRHVNDIRHGFFTASSRSMLPLVHLNADDARDPETVEYVISEADHHAQACRSLNDFVTYVGPRWPQVLLVGDVRHKVELGDQRPAFMPYASTSGLYLLETLRDVDDRYGLVNACDVDNVHELLPRLGNIPVVTLGTRAATELRGECRAVPHPQYVRRFHHRRANDYRDAILGVRTWRP